MALHEESSTFQTVIKNINSIRGLSCSDNSQLIYTTRDGGFSDSRVNQIWRSEFDGSDSILIFESNDARLFIRTQLLTPLGDLLFGTYSRADQSASGIWKIKNVLGTNFEFQEPELIIGPDSLRPFPGIEEFVSPAAFLRTGTHKGDLLLINTPRPPGIAGGSVLRAKAPDFIEVTEFISSNPEIPGMGPFQPLDVAVNSQGEIYVSDFTNDQILRFDDDGKFIEVLANFKNANRLTMGPDHLLFATNTVEVEIGDQIVANGVLNIIDTNTGLLLNSLKYSRIFFEIAVCKEEIEIPIVDTDGDGISNDDDLCPDFPGRPIADGC